MDNSDDSHVLQTERQIDIQTDREIDVFKKCHLLQECICVEDVIVCEGHHLQGIPTLFAQAWSWLKILTMKVSLKPWTQNWALL